MMDGASVQGWLEGLRADYAAGDRALRELDVRREQLVADLLRVSGAMRALEEVLAADRSPVEPLLPSP